MGSEDLSYEVLRQLEKTPSISQRSLAERLGVSVGKVNYCVRALVSKGWLKVNNFRRSDNKVAYTYLLTPSGMAAKVRLTRDFLVRKEKEFVVLRREIETLRKEVANTAPPVEHRIE